ncbi:MULTISPECIES: hypothetical protein [unclassified Kitasatospora]|uniref:hypothetical protein n=1 Tax=unclassified Kitasatospora TaxID=2633591 RepID=UPI00380DB665
MAERTGDMRKLRELIEEVRPGWRVEVTNHDYIKDSRQTTVTHLLDDVYGSGRPGYIARIDGPAVKSQGRSFTTSYFTWPQDGDDFEVQGLTLRRYRQSYGSRVCALTLKFEEAK